MNPIDALYLFGLFVIYLGVGLLLYTHVFGLLLRFHIILFPKLHSKLEQLRIEEHSK